MLAGARITTFFFILFCIVPSRAFLFPCTFVPKEKTSPRSISITAALNFQREIELNLPLGTPMRQLVEAGIKNKAGQAGGKRLEKGAGSSHMPSHVLLCITFASGARGRLDPANSFRKCMLIVPEISTRPSVALIKNCRGHYISRFHRATSHDINILLSFINFYWDIQYFFEFGLVDLSDESSSRINL